MRRWAAVLLVVSATAACGAGASRADRPVIPVSGDATAGQAVIVEYGCGACHRIPGIPNAVSLVGPPLDNWSRRSFIAGILPNSPDNLASWLEDPDSIRPGTAMPDLGLDAQQIADVVAYLYTLD